MQFFVLALMKRYYFPFDRLTVSEKQIAQLIAAKGSDDNN
jgi:hypothetical protein